MERLDNSKLSPLQQRILEKMCDSTAQKLAIVGGPGTGKTVLAMSSMERSDDKKQLMITYSRPLSRMIANCGITCETLCEFCHSIGRTVEKELGDYLERYINDPSPNNALNSVVISEYGYTKEYPWPQFSKLLAAYNRVGEKARQELHYDTIFVDEGQDLPDEAYSFLEAFADRLIVTYDEAQEVGFEEADRSAKLVRKAGANCNRILNVLNLQDSFYDLIDNFRNTVAIERVAKLFYQNYSANRYSLRAVAQIRPDGSKREGSKPRVVFSAVTPKLINQIADRAHQLSRRVGIFIPDMDSLPDKESFDIAKKLLDQAADAELLPTEHLFYKFGSNTNMKDSKETNSYGVFLLTYRTAKGMEFDDVYLIDCQKIDLNTAFQKNQLYVAATRAKENLTFVFDCNLQQSFPVLNIIKEHADCFDMQESL